MLSSKIFWIIVIFCMFSLAACNTDDDVVETESTMVQTPRPDGEEDVEIAPQAVRIPIPPVNVYLTITTTSTATVQSIQMDAVPVRTPTTPIILNPPPPNQGE